MARVLIRFYQELNDFLPPEQRQRDITLNFTPPMPARHLIELCGVPHTEVEIILRNGESIGLEQRIEDGDRLSVYPMFESLDVQPLLRLRPTPLRRPRFVADAHLGRLSHYLRMLGFDTWHGEDPGDSALVALARDEGRILLTRDKALLMHRGVTHGCYLPPDDPQEQLAYLVKRLQLCGTIRPFSRCMECNQPLQPLSREAAVEKVPNDILSDPRQDFLLCPSCDKAYWRGSHYDRMKERILGLCPEAGPAFPDGNN